MFKFHLKVTLHNHLKFSIYLINVSLGLNDVITGKLYHYETWSEAKEIRELGPWN